MKADTKQKQFEQIANVPDFAVYNLDKDSYCWKDRPNVICPDIDYWYELFCAGLSKNQEKVDALEGELQGMVGKVEVAQDRQRQLYRACKFLALHLKAPDKAVVDAAVDHAEIVIEQFKHLSDQAIEAKKSETGSSVYSIGSVDVSISRDEGKVTVSFPDKIDVTVDRNDNRIESFITDGVTGRVQAHSVALVDTFYASIQSKLCALLQTAFPVIEEKDIPYSTVDALQGMDKKWDRALPNLVEDYFIRWPVDTGWLELVQGASVERLGLEIKHVKRPYLKVKASDYQLLQDASSPSQDIWKIKGHDSHYYVTTEASLGSDCMTGYALARLNPEAVEKMLKAIHKEQESFYE